MQCFQELANSSKSPNLNMNLTSISPQHILKLPIEMVNKKPIKKEIAISIQNKFEDCEIHKK